MSDLVKIATQDQVRQILMNRPEKKNALTLTMYQALTDALLAADEDPDVRVIMLGSSGDSFCAGNDINDFIAAVNRPDAIQAPLLFLQTLASLTTPLIAVVPGMAVGIGTTILLYCDLVIASQQACFQLPFARLGLVPEGGSSLLIPQLVGHRRAFELLVIGEQFSAQTAQTLGLVNWLEAPSSLTERAWLEATKLAALPPDAVRQSKAMLRRHTQSQLEAVLVAEVKQFAARLTSEEANEALLAFIQKRTADFSRF
ncbi:enoyl-CoA hydratase-related protein [Amphritea sp. 1_MG-2023]|uniref:enoyl-CoA hydratase-related protein n=1 Tax=Amphritea sp. 1_MG-2023 TaxID=3062670 RepID=UPI0026E1FEED|nr:enoyl-CoA hydratase-related protein [Amphritea sp. 1_MG-2023]MDO6564905.1 enoyl-CoA hydratase-related protein [Amphritea sp. 1_MG-2023]